MKTTISICIPAYNQPSYTAKAVASIFSQTLKDFEIILTDDSIDNSVWDALKKWHDDPRLSYSRNIKPLGSPANWNRALHLATGNLVKFLHHDDHFTSKTALSKFVAVMSENQDVDFAFSSGNACGKNGELLFLHMPGKKAISAVRDNVNNLQFANIIGPPSLTIFRKRKNFKFDENLKWVVDVDAYIRLMNENPKFYFIEEPLLNITSDAPHQVTKTFHKDRLARILEHLYLLTKHRENGIRRNIKRLIFIINIVANLDLEDLEKVSLQINEDFNSVERLLFKCLILRAKYKI